MLSYATLLQQIKSRIREAQTRAVQSVNAQLIGMYWDIGRMLVERQTAEGWGAGVLRRLAGDLRNELPEVKGFSERNLKLMAQFHREYPGQVTIGQPAVAQLPAPREPTAAPLRPAVHRTDRARNCRRIPTRLSSATAKARQERGPGVTFYQEGSAGALKAIVNLGLLKDAVLPLPPLAEKRESIRRVEKISALAYAVARRVLPAMAWTERIDAAMELGVISSLNPDFQE